MISIAITQSNIFDDAKGQRRKNIKPTIYTPYNLYRQIKVNKVDDFI